MRTPITYYGGKQNMLQHLLPLIPEHKIYVEPFVGGGALFWAKPPSYMEAINDINGMVINFYQTIVSDFEALNERIQNTLYSEEIFFNSQKIYQFPEGYSYVDKAWAFWMCTNYAFSGKIGGGWKWCNGTGGSHTGIFFCGKKKEFTDAILHRLEKVQISCRDAQVVMDNRNTPDTLVYLDPPYPGSDQGHYKGYTFGHLQNLLIQMETFKGKFILSNYPSEMMDEAILRNKWFSYAFDKRLSGCRTPEIMRRKTEMIVTNYQINNLFS